MFGFRDISGIPPYVPFFRLAFAGLFIFVGGVAAAGVVHYTVYIFKN